MYPRKIYSALKAHLSDKSVTVLTGMRRTGKTTIVKQLLNELPTQNKLYLDLERIDNREIFEEKNYDHILKNLVGRGIHLEERAYLAIDEVQHSRNLPSIVKYLYDNHDIKWILTGSSSYYLKNHFSESLSGRKKIFELFPLDFSEMLDFNGIVYMKDEKMVPEARFNTAEYARLKGYYEEYVHFGGFPEVVLSGSPERKKDLLNDILSSYINIDIELLSDFRKKGKMYELMKMLASRAGTRLDYAKISVLSGLSRLTVESYIDFFEQTYLLKRVRVYTHNPDREIVKAQKLYMRDNGLLNILGEVSSGTQFENAIFTQMQAHRDIRYYATKSGNEIDYIINGELAIEVKESPTSSDATTLAHLASSIDIKNIVLIGRHQVPNFDRYLWGGEVRPSFCGT